MLVQLLCQGWGCSLLVLFSFGAVATVQIRRGSTLSSSAAWSGLGHVHLGMKCCCPSGCPGHRAESTIFQNTLGLCRIDAFGETFTLIGKLLSHKMIWAKPCLTC